MQVEVIIMEQRGDVSLRVVRARTEREAWSRVHDAVWLPRSIIKHMTRHAVRDGERLRRATLDIPDWKIDQLGWT